MQILTRCRKPNDLDVTHDGKDSSGRGQQVSEDGMQAVLTEAGFGVVEARDGEEALRRVRESKPDLIILDMLLPRLGGEHVLQLLRQDRATACLPVIVLSGLSQKNAGKLKKAGATAYIEKSKLDLTGSGENLVRVVNAALREARSRVGVPA
jgi:CheY-like chemotaxis protein